MQLEQNPLKLKQSLSAQLHQHKLNDMNEDQLREIFEKVKVDSDVIDLQKYRVFIEDVLENELFIGIQKQQKNSEFTNSLYSFNLFGQNWEEENEAINVDEQENNNILCDRSVFKVTLLQNGYGMQKTDQKCLMRFYSPDAPKIFNIVEVYAIKTEFDNQVVLDVVHLSEKKEIEVVENLNQSFAQLKAFLNQVLFDDLASELLALGLLTSVEWRVFQDLGGKLNLNLFGVNKELAQKISSQIQQIYNPTFYVPLTLEYLHKNTIITKKDLEKNELTLGALVPPTNHQGFIIINEVEMQPGTLNEQAYQNLSHLKNILNFNKICIDYTYSQIELEVSVSSLILSEGKSFIEHDIEVLYIYQISFFFQSYHQDNSRINNNSQMQEQIQQQARKVNINEKTKEEINQKYLQLRTQQQDSSKKASPEALTRWVAIMKILSFINGLKDASIEYFIQAIKLDEQRLERLV